MVSAWGQLALYILCSGLTVRGPRAGKWHRKSPIWVFILQNKVLSFGHTQKGVQDAAEPGAVLARGRGYSSPAPRLTLQVLFKCEMAPPALRGLRRKMLCELPRCFANFLLSPFDLLGVETWAPPSNTYLLSMQVMKGEEVNGLGHTTQNLKTF